MRLSVQTQNFLRKFFATQKTQNKEKLIIKIKTGEYQTTKATIFRAQKR